MDTLWKKFGEWVTGDHPPFTDTSEFKMLNNFAITVVVYLDEVTHYEDLWLLGDNFMARSYREGAKLCEQDELLMKRHFNITPAVNSQFTSNNTNMLSRIENSLAAKINQIDKLPKYIAVILDNDIIDFLGYDLYGISEMYGEMLHYLAKSFQ